MRILFSAFACLPERGSEPGVGWNWAIHMAKYNEVWVLTREGNKKCIEEYLKSNPINNLKFIYCSFPIISFLEKKTHWKVIVVYYRLWQMIAYLNARKNDKIYNFDIIHHITYNEFRNPGYLWRLKKPFVLGPLGGGQEIENQLLDYCEGKRNLIKEKVRFWLNLICMNSNYVKNAFKNSQYVFIADSSTYEYLNVKEDKYKLYLETGISKDKVHEKDYLSKTDEEIKILWVGSLIYRKGFGILIDAFNKLENKEKYKVIVIGDGPLKKLYTNRIQSYGLDEYFHFKGKLDYKDVLNYYQQSDFFIFTSLRDTSGNVVIEAMANGLPIVTINHNGVGDIVDENSGIKIDVLTKEQVISDFAKAIQRLGDNQLLRANLGRNACTRIIDNYTWEEKIEFMNKIYKDIELPNNTTEFARDL